MKSQLEIVNDYAPESIDKISESIQKMLDSFSGLTEMTNGFNKSLKSLVSNTDKIQASVAKSNKETTNWTKSLLGVTKVSKNFQELHKTIKGVFDNTLARKIEGIASPILTLETSFSLASAMGTKMSTRLMDSFSLLSETVSTVWKNFTPVEKVSMGLSLMTASIEWAASAGKKLAEEGEMTATSLLNVGGSALSAAASGAVTGSAFGLVGAAIGGLVGLTVGLVTSFSTCTEEMKKVKFEAALFDGIGLPIEEFATSVTDAMVAIGKSSQKTVEWINTYNDSREVIGNTISDLELLNSKLSNSAYSMNIDDINLMNKSLENLTDSVKESGDAFTNASISATQKLVEEGIISQETADLVVSNAIRKAQAEGDAATEYSTKMKDLQSQLDQGAISNEEFRVQSQKLSEEFNKNVEVSDKYSKALEGINLGLNEKIDLKNFTAVREATEEISDAYSLQGKALRDNHNLMLTSNQEAIEASENQIAIMEKNGEKETAEYVKIQEELTALKETREGLTTSFENESDKLDKLTASSFANMLNQMHSTGNGMTDEAIEMSDEIVAKLTQMGYQVDVEPGFLKSIKDAEGNILEGYGTLGEDAGSELYGELTAGVARATGWIASNPGELNVRANTSNAFSKVKELESDISDISPNMDVSVTSVPKNFNFFGPEGFKAILGTFGISSYATGGFPDGENGLFFANSTELVGRFTNGKTAVANNEQIVSGIERGVTAAMIKVMSLGSKKNEPSINVYLDSKDIAKKVMLRGLELEMVRG
ncbi:hypothetical protein G7062_06480 [Erysipelothrix sp. HDW6C]|uniref:hypothetical protein n=1 Tax=Erysipelothrix sp. HDW6C TaxID=2714930 RepID=UPI00140AC79C|nr:hypothetical protein [Erysipelothrix sp. HDW6C]QIK69954.1 hypothetical protein G7062_06480 [Erysipelothrix sp. HDW6C]